MSAGLQLSLLLRQDSHPVSASLPDALGDSYLCQKNAIYAAVRTGALHLGFSFSSRVSPLWLDYQIFPLLCLPEILKARSIPYAANKPFLERLVLQSPRLTLNAAFLQDELKSNYTFHEACHAIAHQVLLDRAELVLELAGSESRAIVWQTMIEEAFANSLERLASPHDGPLAHRLFYWMNSYVSENEEESRLIHAALQALGPDPVFETLLFSFIAANLKPRDALADCAHIARWTGSSSFPELASLGDRLSFGFRSGVAQSYFRYCGVEQDFLYLAGLPLFRDHAQVAILKSLISDLRSLLPPQLTA